MFYVDLFRALDRDEVRYLLIGGLAINIYGVERATMDIDLMLALDDENLQRFLKTAESLNLVPVLPVKLTDLADQRKRQDWAENRNMLAFALRPPEASAPTVDILVQPKIDFEEAFCRRVNKELDGFSLSLASLDDLISLKLDTGRLHDASDIEALRRLRELGVA
jgi:hypothetical protein